MVHYGYKRGYILAQRADFRTYLLMFCSNQSTSWRIDRPLHAGHLAEKLIRHPSRSCAKLSVAESDRHKTCAIENQTQRAFFIVSHNRFYNFYVGLKGPEISGLKTYWFQINFCTNFESSYPLAPNSKSADSRSYEKLIKSILLQITGFTFFIFEFMQNPKTLAVFD